jgi:hypothetical protein
LASFELRCMLGDPASAPAMWRSAVAAALNGYQLPPIMMGA